jgi:uncharacterized protein YdhG (YjbR/CyaY superfamily)/GNAT superfamily N-acetyltransferase
MAANGKSAKRKPRFASVAAYLAAQDATKAKTLEATVELIPQTFPELQAKISWNVPTIHRNGKYVAGIAAYKHHLTFSPWSPRIVEAFRPRLGRYVVMQSSFQIPVDWKIDGKLLRDLVRARLAELDGAVIRVLEFQPAHTHAVASLIIPIQREEFGFPITLADQPDLADIPGFYQHGAGNFWVALHADTVVGTIALRDIGGGQAALRKMFVAAPFRGREHATARQLLDELLAWSRARDLRRIFLGTTAKFLAAHRFYEKHGFREIERTDLPGAFPVMALDTKFYARDT